MKEKGLFVRPIQGSDPAAPTIILLHGLYSSSGDWYSIARELSRQNGSTIYLIDLPNHGHSLWTQEHTYASVCQHIQDWIEQQDFTAGSLILLGHSFGARVAMILAQRLAPLLRSYAMIDMSPLIEPRSDRMVSLWHAMLLGRMVEASQTGVTNIKDYLIQHQIDPQLAQGLTLPYRQMNIKAVWEGVMNLRKELQAIQTPAFWQQLQDTRLLIIRAGESHYVPQDTEQLMIPIFRNAQIQTIPNASHNIHLCSPIPLTQALLEFIQEPSSDSVQ